MRAEAADYLKNAGEKLIGARKILSVGLPDIAAREAYLAAFHAAEAYIFDATGKIAKTHRGVRAEFSRLIQNDPRADTQLVTFLSIAYRQKENADYAIGAAVRRLTQDEAEQTIAQAGHFIEAITQLLPPDEPP